MLRLLYMFTYIYPRLLVLTCDYLCLLMFTYIIRVCTYVYL